MGKMANIEMERMVVGSVLLDPVLASFPKFRAELFSDPICRTVCETCRKLMAGGKDINPLSVSSGTGASTSEIVNLSTNVVSTAGFEDWLDILEAFLLRRETCAAFTPVIQLAQSDESTPEAIKELSLKAQRRINNLGHRTVLTTRQKLTKIVESVKGNVQMLTQVDYGLPWARDVEHYKGQIHSIGGKPGVGKTALGLTILGGLIKSGQKGVYICKESRALELFSRLIGQDANIAASLIMRGGLETDRALKVLHEVGQYARLSDSFAIIGMGEFDASIEGVADSARRFAFDVGGIDYLLIDYIQALGKAEDEKAKDEQIFSRIGKTMDGAMRLTEELDCATIAFSQLSRDARKVKGLIPSQTSFMGSSEIEFNSHIMSALYREGEDNDRVSKGEAVYETWWASVKTRLVRPFCRKIGFKAENQQYVALHGTYHKMSADDDPPQYQDRRAGNDN